MDREGREARDTALAFSNIVRSRDTERAEVKRLLGCIDAIKESVRMRFGERELSYVLVKAEEIRREREKKLGAPSAHRRRDDLRMDEGGLE